MSLSEKRCIPCEGGALPLSHNDSMKLLHELQGWELSSDEKSISKLFTYKDFADAMDFANRIAEIANAENHHPDLHISWGKLQVVLSTHAIGGLSENDFIVAAKIDQLTAH